jgi:thiol-disulfide isomerase/thioredoxin
MKHAYLIFTVFCLVLVVMRAAGDTNETRATTNHSIAASTQTDRAEKAAFERAMETFMPAMDASDAGKAVDFSVLRKSMGEFWKDFPDVRRSVTLLTWYMAMYARAHPEGVQAEWASFTNSSSPLAADLARGKVRFDELSRQPFDLAFVALDGRAVDLDKLRGKVVLIDFWATWCMPCLGQMPTLKRFYAAYHEQGLEIIGVSLDRAEDKRKLADFVSREGLAWPQHFDGKGWQNEIAMRYAINSAPTTFLLDTEGRLVGINLEADKLESEITRLLGVNRLLPENIRAEPGGPANGSQPIRSETNRTSSAAGSRR